jgi:hypothetical protein
MRTPLTMSLRLISEDIPEENSKKDKKQRPPIAPKPQLNDQSKQGTSSVVRAPGVPPPPPPPHSKPIGVPVRGAPSNKKIDSEKSAQISTDELKKKIEASQARRNKK